ncbi:MAG: Gfo/Idh/MocA family oxidoreductase [Verrucomicrobiota bacterium]|nr:Gfo/Idh/MocA family oxidoreductase [Verrucomicrobiota bacterium]
MNISRWLGWLFATSVVLNVQAKDLRIGMVGLDTSHVTAFTRILNDKSAKDHIPGGKVVAAVKDSSPDIESSYSRVEKYTAELTGKWGVKLYPTMEEMCRHVDAVMIENVDGRPHLKHATEVIKAGKPLFIDKPLAGTLDDCVKIYRLAKRHNVPVFSSSSLRFAKATLAARAGKHGKVLRCETFSPAHLEPHHPDLFWYGIHGVESLFTVMGSGCVSVQRGTTKDGKIIVTGKWNDGRIGIFREGEGYGGTAKCESGEQKVGSYDGYAPLVKEVMRFFKTGKSPVNARETLEIYAFMQAADESKVASGKKVPLKLDWN